MRNRSRIVRRLVTAVVFSAAVVGGGAMAVAKTGGVNITRKLTATGHAPRARGLAKLSLKSGSSGTFSVRAKHLPGGQTFDVVVNKVKVGTLTTSPSGSGSAKFSTAPHGRAAMLGFDPQGAEVEVRDEQGEDDLDGEMPGGNPSSAIGCCLPDDDGETECEPLTAADCTAHGGTATSATGCFPNPCPSQPPPTPVVCCIAHSAAGAFVDDDPEVECEDDASSAECAAEGGMVVHATSCEPNPCQPTPPPNLVICCVSQGDQGQQQGQPQTEPAECAHITAAECTAEGGTASTATSCQPDPCGGGGSGGDQGEGGGGDQGQGGGGGDD